MYSIIISYDLGKPNRNYDALYKDIKSATTWAKLTESTWLIKTNNGVAYWRDKLKNT